MGFHAVMWNGANVTDLNNVFNVSGWRLGEAAAINDAGEIVPIGASQMDKYTPF